MIADTSRRELRTAAPDLALDQTAAQPMVPVSAASATAAGSTWAMLGTHVLPIPHAWRQGPRRARATAA